MTGAGRRRRPGHLVARVALIPFVAAALVALSPHWSQWSMDPVDTGTWVVDRLLPSLGFFATPLIGAALLIRHPDARRRLPLVLMGAILLAAEALLVVAVEPIATVFGRAQGIEGPSIMAIMAIQGFLSLVGAFGYAYLARGLAQARRAPDRGPARVVIAAVIVIIVAFLLLLTSILGSYGVPGEVDAMVVAALSFGSLMARVAALGYLAVTVSRGWLAGEARRRAWGVAAVGAWATFLAASLWVAVGYAASVVPFPDAASVGRVLAIAAGVGPVLLLAAFVDGLPDTDRITWYDLARLDAAAAATAAHGQGRDPFDDGGPLDEPDVFELEDRRLDR